MTTKVITILKSTSPITILNKPSDKTIEALAKWLSDPVYLSFVETTRKKNILPGNGTRYWFKKYGIQEKKEILLSFGSNFLVKTKTLGLDALEPFLVVKKVKSEVVRIMTMFEPEENHALTPQMAYAFDQSLLLRGAWDDFGTFLTSNSIL